MPLLQPREGAAPAGRGRPAPTPPELTITVRDRRFPGLGGAGRWWLNGDPVATAWFTALSATFPRGEAFFIESVRAHRAGAPAKLADAIRCFVRQEANHSREHLALNRAATAAGYDLSGIDRRVADHLAVIRTRPAIVNLAATMALEHFTAMLANRFLSDPRHFAGADGELAALWRWHAVEEIEHKAVAYDTWRHATRHWSRWKRWKVKSLLMLIVTRTFLAHRLRDTCDLLAQDGLTGTCWRARLAWYMLGRPGILRQILPAWLGYFLPGFHPWNHDDRQLIARHEPGRAGAAAPR